MAYYSKTQWPQEDVFGITYVRRMVDMAVSGWDIVAQNVLYQKFEQNIKKIKQSINTPPHTHYLFLCSGLKCDKVQPPPPTTPFFAKHLDESK